MEGTRHVVLGHYLRTRRERLKPEEVGLDAGGHHRRRAVGLRREEVAVLANVSPAWYSRLEQGNKVRPSPEILDSLADALRLGGSERRYLHALGTDRVPTAAPPVEADDRTLRFVRRIVESCTADPVLAVDTCGDVVCGNAAVAEWYTDFNRRTGRDRNFLWWLLTAPEARVRIADWAAFARDQVAMMRYAVGTRTSDPRVTAMLEVLHTHCADFRRWWETHDVADEEIVTRTFRHPRHGLQRLEVLAVRPPVSSSVTVMIHCPPGPGRPRPEGLTA